MELSGASLQGMGFPNPPHGQTGPGLSGAPGTPKRGSNHSYRALKQVVELLR